MWMRMFTPLDKVEAKLTFGANEGGSLVFGQRTRSLRLHANRPRGYRLADVSGIRKLRLSSPKNSV